MSSDSVVEDGRGECGDVVLCSGSQPGADQVSGEGVLSVGVGQHAELVGLGPDGAGAGGEQVEDGLRRQRRHRQEPGACQGESTSR